MSDAKVTYSERDQLLREIDRLGRINKVLMDRVERSVDSSGSAFSLFESNILLQNTITERTRELAQTNEKLRSEIRERQQAEQILLESKEKYRVLFEYAADLVAVLDADGRFVDVNGKFERELGYARNDLLGRDVPSVGLLTEKSVSLAQRWLPHLVRGETIPVFEVEARCKDGRIIPYELQTTSVMQRGKLSLIQTSWRNITERKIAEHDRRERLQAVRRLQSTMMKLMVHPAMGEGDFKTSAKTVTESAADALRVERAGVWLMSDDRTALQCLDLYRNSQGDHQSGVVLHISEYPRYFSALGQGRAVDAHNALTDSRTSEFAEGYLRPLGISSMLDAPIRMNGEIIGVVCIEHSGAPRTWTPDEIGFAAALSDQMTQVLVNAERRKAEAALRSSEARYRTLFDCANDAIFIMRQDCFIDCNVETLRIFGCTRDQIIGQPPYRFSPEAQPDGRCSTEKSMERINAALSGEPQFFDWIHSRYNGSTFPAEVSLNRMDIGEETFLLAIVRDITERKHAEAQHQVLREQLERAERMESLAVLAGGVAHDLNNMLGPLVGYPELILRKLDRDSPLRQKIQRIEDSARQAADVIQDLLTLARRGRYEMEPINLNTVVESYLRSPSFDGLRQRSARIELELHLSNTLPRISGSAPHLGKVVMNLVVNAMDAMTDGGVLTIETSHRHYDQLLGGYSDIEPGEYVALAVRDTGRGIDPEHLDKIFEPYFSKKEMGASGSGLGLSVVYGVVKDHKGYYDVLSEPGQGTEFVVYLPVCRTAAEPGCRIDDSDLNGSERVLIVDDSPEQREVAEALVSSLGYEVSVVENGHEALEFLRHQSVDLVILDMIMEKDFDGLDTYRELIKIQPGCPVVIVSGFSATQRVAEMQRLGAGPYVKKPYTIKVIGRALRRALQTVSSE